MLLPIIEEKKKLDRDKHNILSGRQQDSAVVGNNDPSSKPSPRKHLNSTEEIPQNSDFEIDAQNKKVSKPKQDGAVPNLSSLTPYVETTPQKKKSRLSPKKALYTD